MAHYRKDKGRWRAEIAKAGVRVSRTFDTKAAAQAWAIAEEAAIQAGERDKFPNKTLADAMRRYELDVSSGKRGRAFEVRRFAFTGKTYPALVAKVLHQITSNDLAEWRDSRLKTVTKGTVQREINLLRNVWTVAANEWGWCDAPGPWRGMRRPGHNLPRTRRIPWTEAKHVMRWAGFKTGTHPSTKTCECSWAFLVALRTAMRAGEILGLELDDVDLTKRVVRLREHKTVEIVGVRYVPISTRAARVLGVMCRWAKAQGRKRLFTMTPEQLSALWHKLLGQAGIEGLTFHDSRAEALTLMARRVDVLTLSRISGHRDIRVLQQSYYRESAEQIAARL